jgi:hypothetical protein
MDFKIQSGNIEFFDAVSEGNAWNENTVIRSCLSAYFIIRLPDNCVYIYEF